MCESVAKESYSTSFTLSGLVDHLQVGIHLTQVGFQSTLLRHGYLHVKRRFISIIMVTDLELCHRNIRDVTDGNVVFQVDINIDIKRLLEKITHNVAGRVTPPRERFFSD